MLLDGVDRTCVLEADEERRYIVRHKTDERGKPVFSGGEYVRERLEGCVVIQPWPEDNGQES